VGNDNAVREERDTLQERENLASLSLDISEALTQEIPLTVILQLCAEVLVRDLGVSLARIWVMNKNETMLELKASAGLYTHLNGFHSRIPMGKYKIGRIAQNRQPHLTNQVLGDPQVHDQEWVRREGMVGFAGYPLIVEDRVVGVLAVFSRNQLSEATLQVMSQIAHAIALGLDHQSKHEELKHLQHQNDLILQSAGQGIYGLDLQGNFTFGNPAAAQLIGWDRQELMEKDMHRILHHTRGDGTPYPAEECPIYRTMQEGKSHHVDSELFWRKDGTSFFVEYISTPIWEEERIVGAVVTFQDISKQREVENQLKQQQSRLLNVAVELSRAREKERQRIAQGLHDEVGQMLATLKLNLGMLGESALAEKEGARLAEAKELVNQTIRTVRSLTFELGSLVLSELGFTPAIKNLVAGLQSRNPFMNVQITLPEKTITPHEEQANLLHAIVKELIHNIEKHARASRVSIMVEVEGGHLQIRVEDNGLGFSSAEATEGFSRTGGFGLLSIHAQVKNMGGRVEIETASGAGTRIMIEAPWSEPNEDKIEKGQPVNTNRYQAKPERVQR
jgi:PAS domain S-box-containing protein